MNPLIEVCVYVPWGQEIMARKCYDKEIPTHWDNGTNGLLAPLTLVGRGVVPSGQPLVLWVKLPKSSRNKDIYEIYMRVTVHNSCRCEGTMCFRQMWSFENVQSKNRHLHALCTLEHRRCLQSRCLPVKKFVVSTLKELPAWILICSTDGFWWVRPKSGIFTFLLFTIAILKLTNQRAFHLPSSTIS